MFITTKPVIYLVNLSEKDYIRKKNKWLIKIKEFVDKNDPGAIIIPFSGVFENKIIEMEEPERKKYMEEVQATRFVSFVTMFYVVCELNCIFFFFNTVLWTRLSYKATKHCSCSISSQLDLTKSKLGLFK